MMVQRQRKTNVTIVEVAREAGVSTATVSRVINNDVCVRPDTRERVLQTMQSLGYVVNPSARRLAGGPARVIGLIVRDLGTGYIGEIVRGVDAELESAQYDLMLYTTHHQVRQEINRVGALTKGMVDGLLLVLPREPEAYLTMLQSRQYPCVLIDHQGVGSFDSAVGATNKPGAYVGVEYLIQLGHRRIGFITGQMDLGCARDRLAGYQAALQAHGLPIDPDLVRPGDFFQPRGYAAAQELLSLAEPPTAIFASNDVSSFGVMEAVRERGLHIPEDISVMGFDDIPQAADTYPPLTTVRQPLEQMGRTAARNLLAFIRAPQTPPARVDLPTSLVVRKSCQPPRDQSLAHPVSAPAETPADRKEEPSQPLT